MDNTQAPALAREATHLRIAEALCAHIRALGLQPGDRLPPERQLAAQFSCGRNTIRQAQALLARQGIIRLVSGRGAFLEREPGEEPLRLRLMEVDYKDLLDIKMWLEQLAIRRAAERADAEALDGLTACADALSRDAQQGRYSVATDRAFHTQLLQCAGSPTLTQLVLGLVDALNLYAPWLEGTEAVWLKTVPFHVDICTALRQGRTSAALAAHEYIHLLDLDVLAQIDQQPLEE